MYCEIPGGHGGHHHGGHHHGGHEEDSACCCHPRVFLTKKERVERLEEYAKSLEQELAGVKEHLEELKKKA